jgi:hypothetical protein
MVSLSLLKESLEGVAARLTGRHFEKLLCVPLVQLSAAHFKKTVYARDETRTLLHV